MYYVLKDGEELFGIFKTKMLADFFKKLNKKPLKMETLKKFKETL